jgi:hypothetical protein
MNLLHSRSARCTAYPSSGVLLLSNISISLSSDPTFRSVLPSPLKMSSASTEIAETIEAPPTYAPRRLSTADFETASIRSAAPSYTSAAPTYHSSLDGPTLPRRTSAPPQLSDFRIPTWSTTRANPTARHYHSVAHRRATIASARDEQKIIAAALTPNPVAAIMQTLEEEEMEKYRDRERPLEDEELVGREAAEKARQERIGWGRAVLIREDKRWDWLLGES